jgi:hypothetical protein
MFQVEICSQQLEICKSVCMIIILSIQPRQNGSDGIRTRCKSAGVAKQRLYDQDDDTMIEQLYKFVVYKVYLM